MAPHKIIAFFVLGFVLAVSGEPRCLDDSSCTPIPDSKCIDGKCTCTEDLVLVDFKKCLPEATSIGAPCEGNDQCRRMKAICLKSPDGLTMTCQCREGDHFTTTCLEDKGLGDICRSSDDCYIPEHPDRIICAANNTCVCKDGFHQVDDTCSSATSSIVTSLSLGVVLSVLSMSTVWRRS